jgi:hypothetical protein
MNLDLVINKLNVKYYKGLQLYLNKNGTDIKWLNDHIESLSEKIQDEKNSDTQDMEKKREQHYSQSSETSKHNQIFADENLYKKPWVKLTLIHKILKIKEFVNNLKIDSENDRTILRDELVALVKTKVLTKKEKINYDELNGKLISLANLQYKDGKYYYSNE